MISPLAAAVSEQKQQEQEAERAKVRKVGPNTSSGKLPETPCAVLRRDNLARFD
jgi:hypothetical protein